MIRLALLILIPLVAALIAALCGVSTPWIILWAIISEVAWIVFGFVLAVFLLFARMWYFTQPPNERRF